jgi:uncharacterized membrane protein YccC
LPIRAGVAVSAAIWIGNAPGLVENHSSWILITVLMVLQPTSGGSMLKGLLRMIGTVAAAFTAIVLLGLYVQDHPMLIIGLFLVQAVGAYGNSGTRFQYAWFVWAFTTAIVLGDEMAGQGAIETVAFQRASMIGIGILIVLLVDSLILPARAEPQLRQSLAARARYVADVLQRVVASRGAPAPDSDASSSGSSPSTPDSLVSQLELVGFARGELGSSAAEVDSLERAAILLETLASRARILARVEGPTPDAGDDALSASLVELGSRIRAALDGFAAALEGSQAPVLFSDDLQAGLAAFEADRDGLAGGRGRSTAEEGWVSELRDLVAVLCELESAVSLSDASPTESEPWALLHFRPDPFRMKTALRSGIAVVVAFLVPVSLGWPTNSLVAPFSFLVAGFTRGAGVQVLTSLVTVLGLGWLAADLLIVEVTPHLSRAPAMLVVPFAVAAGFAYVSASRPKLAMLFSMGGVVAFLSAFPSGSASTDVYGSYSTVCYMAVGLGVGWLFSRLMWPATCARLFRERVAVQLGHSLEAFRTAREVGDTGRGRRGAELLRACATQSAQLGPLHAMASREPVELSLDPARRSELLALAIGLADAVAGARPGASTPLLERLGQPLRPLLEALKSNEEALLGSMQLAVDALEGKAEGSASNLASAHQLVTDCVKALRADPARLAEVTDDERRQLMVQLDSNRRLVLRQQAVEDWLAEWQSAQVSRA